MKESGAPPDVLETARANLEAKQREQDKRNTFEVWPENWRAFELFWNMQHCWVQAGGLGGLEVTGLRWEALDTIERRLTPRPDDTVPDSRTLFEQLRTLEDEALRHLNDD